MKKQDTLKIVQHLQKKTCPACEGTLVFDQANVYDHFTCPKCKNSNKISFKVMYEKGANQWLFFRASIPNTDLFFERFSVEVKSEKLTIKGGKDRNKNIEVPYFDVVNCSFEEMESKFKLYVVFS